MFKAVEDPITAFIALEKAEIEFIATLDAVKLVIAVWLLANSVISEEFDAISLNTEVHFVPDADANADPS